MHAVARGGDEPKTGKEKAGAAANSAKKVSYDKQIRPILQAHCQGCHQPAKAGGGYVMTAFDRMLKGGESGEPAIVPGKPDESHLVEHDHARRTARPRCPRTSRRFRPARSS